jgi:hypothetical protein
MLINTLFRSSTGAYVSGSVSIASSVQAPENIIITQNIHLQPRWLSVTLENKVISRNMLMRDIYTHNPPTTGPRAGPKNVKHMKTVVVGPRPATSQISAMMATDQLTQFISHLHSYSRTATDCYGTRGEETSKEPGSQ